MIYLAPLSDRKEIRAFFEQKGFEFNKFSGCLTATVGKELLGISLYELDGKKMTVHYIEPLSDIALADGILRSTLHIAAEKSIMDARYSETLPEAFLEKIGFIADKEQKALQINKLFQSCCNC